jgi:hypothetical protein
MFVKPLFSIVQIAVKYHLNPKNFLDSFLNAWRNKDDDCGRLHITCRRVSEDDDSVSFLVTHDERVVSQFPVKIEALKNHDSFEEYFKEIPIREIQKRYDHSNELKNMKISQLRYDMKRVCLKAEIVEIPPVRGVVTRFGNIAKVTNIKIADETGPIHLSVWNEHIDELNVGDEIQIENGYVSSYQGEPQLRLGRKGKITRLTS